MFETAFLSPHIFIKSIIIAASAAEMTAIPIVPNSHFLPLSLAVRHGGHGGHFGSTGGNHDAFYGKLRR
jgi:hypothetical protein